MELEKDVAIRVPVRLLLSADFTGETGLAFGDVTVYLQKQSGSAVLKVLGAGDWFEVDSVNMPGVYDLQLSSADTDTLGFLKYSVTALNCEPYYGLMEVVPNEAGVIEDAVWDATSAAHVTAGTMGAILASPLVQARTVRAGFKLDSATNTLIGNIWLEHEGIVDTTATAATAEFYNSSGVLLFGPISDGAPDAQGIFRVTQAAPPGLSGGSLVYARLEITYPSGTIRTIQSFHVSKTETDFILDSIIFNS